VSTYDLAVIGAGPAGSSCAAFAARSGLGVAIVDREAFPRHKVCGDCLNPSCWPLLDQLELTQSLFDGEHAELRSVTLEATSGTAISVPLPPPPRGEIAIARELFDDLLLRKAASLGAIPFPRSPVERIERDGCAWSIHTSSRTIRARTLVAADGRNSTVAHLLGFARKEPPRRVAFQAHLPLPDASRGNVLLKVLPQGYCGASPVNERELNLCLVSRTDSISQIKVWAEERFPVPDDIRWHSIAPLERADRDPLPRPDLFFIGDAARVVEPFTGEGIYYALHTGRLAARAVVLSAQRDNPFPALRKAFLRDYRALYRDRLWVNRLTRYAVTHPAAGDALIAAGKAFPALLPYLTSKIVRSAQGH